MKKFILHFTLLCFVILSPPAAGTAFAEEAQPGRANETAIVMAINQGAAVLNGEETAVTPPILVFGKTYVDLYAAAPLLGYQIDWIESEIGYFHIRSDKAECDFTRISYYDDLSNQEHKFFVKQNQIFVSLRELADLLAHPIAYDNGVIYIGQKDVESRKVYGTINPFTWDDYVYANYPYPAEYTVGPYHNYSYENMLSDAATLQKRYPDIIKTGSIGKSVEGRELLRLELGRGNKKIFVCGTHHAREYIATTYLMYAVDRYAYAYRTNTMWGKYNPRDILDQITFVIVPMVNPDGVNLVQNGLHTSPHAEEIANMRIFEGAQYGYAAWKANVHGVDVNWNYDKDWTITRNKNARGSTGFNGDYPNSEPETAAVAAYVDTHPFDAYLSFHTQGEIFYWADSKANPMHIHQAVRNDTGFAGYPDDGQGIGGSFFDYVYRKFDKPTITVELCPYVGNYPYPNENFDTVWNHAKNILLVVGNEILWKG